MALTFITCLTKPEHPFSCITIAQAGSLLLLEVFKFKKHLRPDLTKNYVTPRLKPEGSFLIENTFNKNLCQGLTLNIILRGLP